MTRPAAVPAPEPPALPPGGRVEFDDGDWVQLVTDPTHGQSKAVAKAILSASASSDRGATLDLMGTAIAAVAKAGRLTDAETGEAVPFPLTPEALDRVSGAKVVRLFRAAIAIPDLIPNL